MMPASVVVVVIGVQEAVDEASELEKERWLWWMMTGWLADEEGEEEIGVAQHGWVQEVLQIPLQLLRAYALVVTTPVNKLRNEIAGLAVLL
jgi:hypothetical protein